MASIYDRADIYDLFDDENRYEVYKHHWETVLEGKRIQTMLARCAKKAEAKGQTVELKCSDFRDLSCWQDRRFDLVASTGNALGYVVNEDVVKTLERMDSLTGPGGYLYFDTRNWDKILRERNRFYPYNPLFDGENRINVTQAWDYNNDGSMTFNILYTFERENRIFQKEIFEEHYYPVSWEILQNKLREMGYRDIGIKCFPACFEMAEFEQVEWYCVIARKP